MSALATIGAARMLRVDDDAIVYWWSPDGATQPVTVTVTQSEFPPAEIARGWRGSARIPMILTPGYLWRLELRAGEELLDTVEIDRRRAQRLEE